MKDRAKLNRRIARWLHEHNYSPRRLSLEAGCGEGMVRRILESDAYRPGSDTWRKLAQRLGWDESEVLALAGIGAPPTTLEGDPLAIIDQQLRRLEFDDAEREWLADTVRLFLRRRAAGPSSPAEANTE